MEKYAKFREDDPVWVKCGKQWWPALTCTTPHGNMSSIPQNQAFFVKADAIFKRSTQDHGNWPPAAQFKGLTAAQKTSIRSLGNLGEDFLRTELGVTDIAKRPAVPSSKSESVAKKAKTEKKSAEVVLGKAGLDITFRATLLIQRLFRGWAGRQEARRLRLWKAWNALDMKAENDLVQSQRTFTRLKELYDRNLTKSKSEADEQKALEKKLKTALESAVPKKVSMAVSGSLASLPRLSASEPLALEFVTKMMDEFKRNKILDRDNIFNILQRATPLLKRLPNVVRIPVHAGGKITVVGDVHGQLNDVLSIFELNGLPDDRNQYLFNGDIVDRGPCGVECAIILLSFKVLFPEAMHINRGNHESDDVNEKDGFFDEVTEKYDRSVYDAFSEVFALLPLASIIQDKVWVVHGGLTAPDVTMDDIMKFNRFVRTVPSNTAIEDMLWSDPMPKNGRGESERGAGAKFGPDVTKAWLSKNKLELVVRSHEVASNGFVKLHGGALYTVFSASNYCNEVGNKGAIILFEQDMKPNCVTFSSKANDEISTSNLMSLEQHIIPQLCTAIAVNRLGLIDYWSKLSKKGASDVISRTEWNTGLTTVLGLQISFLPFQRQLGLPLLGHDGTKGGPINYMAFVNRFRPIFASPAPKKSRPVAVSPMPLKSKKLTASKKETTKVEAAVDENQLLDELAQFLLKERYQLRSLFRFFDLDGNGTVNKAELKAGLNSLGTVFKRPISSEEVDKLFSLLDTNGDGEVDYEELVAAVTVQCEPSD